MGPNRAYSTLQIKAVSEDARTITGIASTPTPDRMGDIVEPKGARFSLPIPLLWQHRSDTPIGHVIAATVTDDGIEITAQIASEDTPGELKTILDRAWQSIKKGLVRGLSIGFKPLETAEIEGSWAEHFLTWEWLELSAVTIPANAEATIATIKAHDAGHTKAASGRVLNPGVPGHRKTIKHTNKGGHVTITERIAAFEATRAAKAARMAEIADAAGAEGRTKDEAEQVEFDEIRDDITAIDRELKDLRDMERINVAAAKPVKAGDGASLKGAEGARDPARIVVTTPKAAPGIEFARFAMCLAAAKGNVPQALALAREHYPNHDRVINVLSASERRGMTPEKLVTGMKAAVAGGTTADATWAGPLVEYNQFAGDFVSYLRPMTILGKFGTNGIPDLRSIPFNVHIRGQTSGGTGYWVGQGKPKPVTKFDFNDANHTFAKVAAISVITEELIRFSDPAAERLVRDGLAEALVALMDTDFVDPAKAVSAGVSPASITNGVAAITSSGVDADAVRADIAALWAASLAANLPITSAVYITTPSVALGLSLMRTALGTKEFPDISLMGGEVDGVPTIVSNYVPAGTFILVFASEIWFSDDGTVTVDASREASIEMLNNPTNDAAAGTATAMVSMYQTDSVALRAHRYVNWSKRRSTAVALLDEVAWGAAES